MKTTFLYTLSDPNTGKTRYLGKSDNPFSRFKDHCRKVKGTATSNWIRGLKARSQVPLMDLLDEIPVAEWQFWEREYLRVFRAIGIPLLNHADGGEGGALDAEAQARRVKTITGRKQTPEHIEKNAASRRGQKRTLATRQAMSEAAKGRVFSEEHRKNLGAALRGKPLSAAHCEALSRARTGMKFSAEHRRNMSLAATGRKFSDTHRRSLSLARAGRPLSDSHRLAMSRAQKARFQRGSA